MDYEFGKLTEATFVNELVSTPVSFIMWCMCCRGYDTCRTR